MAVVETHDWELSPDSRSYRLRERFWQRTHEEAVRIVPIEGVGAPGVVGYARDYGRVLEASEPFIQPDEMIVGSWLALPHDPQALEMGYYNPHYPPGYPTLMRLGFTGIRDEARVRLEGETDPERADFLEGVVIAYDAACRYVERYAEHAEALAEATPDASRRDELRRVRDVCRELATGLPTTFHAALQLVQFTRVLGGWGCIGRFDQWILPFYARDLASGRLTEDGALELLECLFIKMNEFSDENPANRVARAKGASAMGRTNDDLRNIALAGQTPDGADACNALTMLCLTASARLMLPEPKLNVRFFPGTPRGLLRDCCRLLAKGGNVLAIFNDEVAIPALTRLGIPIEDARDYCNDGCSELIIGGKSAIRFRVDDSVMALRQAVLDAPEPYETFDELMIAFKANLGRFIPSERDEPQAITHPFFAAGIEDCLGRASVMGARYSIWGSILAEVGNAADGLAAIQRLVYDEKKVPWETLVAALRADYDGHEPLRQMLLHRPPKYGNDIDAVDALAREIAEWFCDGVHTVAGNVPGPGPKRGPGLMCFGLESKRQLPATPDGRRQGDPTANSFSPSVGMDRSGPTAVLQSVAKVDLTKASHGSVLDIALHNSLFGGDEGIDKLVALIDTYLTIGGTATLQLNVIDRDTLLRARCQPDAPEFRTLIVRVWGFSAVFVDLPMALQDHVLARTEHGAQGTS